MVDSEQKSPLTRGPIHGKFTTLSELTQDDVSELWENMTVAEIEIAYKWLIIPVPKSCEEQWNTWKSKDMRIAYAVKADPKVLNHNNLVLSNNAGALKEDLHKRVTLGIMAFTHVDLENQTVEIGVFYSPILQRTVASTEAAYLLLRAAFEPFAGPRSGESPPPPFHRVMWKCNSLNVASRRAAERLGFVHEGRLRKSRWDKSRWISPDWLSMLDEDWPAVQTAFKAWLEPSNFDEAGRQKQTLERLRSLLPAAPS